MFPAAITHPLALGSSSFHPAARAFQLAFEAAREPVRFAVLHTFKIWEWELSGTYPSKDALHSVYTRAPGDLREAVDYIIHWDSVSWLRNIHDLQCQEDSRRAAADSYEEMLSMDDHCMGWDSRRRSYIPSRPASSLSRVLKSKTSCWRTKVFRRISKLMPVS